ncbi:hypothetical protein O3M35_008571 [Rhynocoris fuscipes]|uniref:Chemosensory protein n=1 Tax=Rhynocoris fuscipes TaxID=488301 RepID=A0AAW1DDQ4_9HEMI
MLRTVFILSFVAALSVAYPQGSYSDKFDNVNVDAILNDEATYQTYFNCLANRGPCSPEGDALKRILPDALQNRCNKCTEKQKAGAIKIITFLLLKKHSDFEVLANIYDPQGIYRQKYGDLVKKRIGK